MDINNFIQSFGDFIVDCAECDIPKNKALKIMMEFLDNPKKYDHPEIIKSYLNENLDINQFIQLNNKIWKKVN